MRKPDYMLQDLLSNYHLILGSGSPRRKELMQQMGLIFEVRPPVVEEKVPKDLMAEAIPDNLARLKADALACNLRPDDILITADTIVWHEGRHLGKPGGKSEAVKMLKHLSGDWHEVITTVCCTSTKKQRLSHETTLVHFKELREEEILYYVSQFRPWDKAGAYGIQEWLGLVGIAEISGSYTNVVGLPTASLYELLRIMVS